MNSKTNYVCVTCPLGCTLQVEYQGNSILKVEGNQCKKGLQYAEMEHNDPRRMLTTTVKVKGGLHPLAPVQSIAPIPKHLIFNLMDELRQVEIRAPVRIGEVILKNISGTGIDIIASRDLPIAENQANDSQL
jgi:CxxC motif-containing protein